MRSASITHGRHFDVATSRWQEIADTVAPRSVLLGQWIEASTLETLERRIPHDAGELAFVIEPSQMDGYVIFMSVLESTEFEDAGDAKAIRAAEWVGQRWDSARARAEDIMGSVLG